MHIFHSFKVTAKRYYTPETLCRGLLDLSKESRLHLLANAPFDYMYAIHDDGVTFTEEKCNKCTKTREFWTLGKS